MKVLPTAIAWLVSTAILAPICFFAAIFLAGPHSSLMPSFMQPAALAASWMVFIGVPIWVGGKVWRRSRHAPPPPSFDEWLALSERERRDMQSRWNAYGGQGHDLVAAVTADFRSKYGHLPQLQINGPGVYHGGYWVIGVAVPAAFDRRQLPSEHLGITVHTSLRPEPAGSS
jgi:hypothetical protein